MINEGESHKKQRLMQTPYTGAEAVGKLLKNFGQISEAVSRFGNTLNAIHIAAENIEHEFRNLASMMSMTRYSMSMSSNSPMHGAGAKRTNFPSPQERLIEFEVVERAKNNIRDQLKQERGEQPFKDNATRLEEYELFLEEKEKAYKSHKDRMDDLYKKDGKAPVTTDTKINEYQRFLDEKYTRLQTYLKKELDLFATMQKARGFEKAGINKVIFDYEESQKSQNKRNKNNKNNNSGSDYVSGPAPDYSEMPTVPKKKAAIVVLDFETAGAPGADIQKDKNDYVKSADIIQIAAEFRDDVGNVLETFNVFLDKRSKEITLPSKQGLDGDKFAGLQKAWQEAKDNGSMVTMEDAAAKLKSIIDSIVVPGVTKFVVKDTFDTEIVQNNDTDKNKLLQPVLAPFMQNSDVIDVQDVFKQLFEKEKETDPSKQSATQRAMADVDSTSGGTNYDKQIFTIETMFKALKGPLEDLANDLKENSTDLGNFHNALGDVRIESLLYLFATRKLKAIAKESAAKNPNPVKGSKGNTASSTNTSPKKPNTTYTSNGGVQKVEVVAPLPLPVIIVGGGGNFGGGGGNGGGSNGGNGAPPFTLTFPMVDDKWIEKSIEALRKERENNDAREAGGKPASSGKPPAPNDNFVTDNIVDQIINGGKPTNPSQRRLGPTLSQPIGPATSYSPIKDPDFVPTVGTPKTEQQVKDEEAYERQNRSTSSFIDPVNKNITVDPNQSLVVDPQLVSTTLVPPTPVPSPMPSSAEIPAEKQKSPELKTIRADAKVGNGTVPIHVEDLDMENLNDILAFLEKTERGMKANILANGGKMSKWDMGVMADRTGDINSVKNEIEKRKKTEEEKSKPKPQATPQPVVTTPPPPVAQPPVAKTPPASTQENKKVYTNEEIIAALRNFEKESASGKYDGKIVNGKLTYEDVQLPPEVASLEKGSTLFNQSYNKGDIAAFEKYNSATIQREKGSRPDTLKPPEIIFNNINGIGRSSTTPSNTISNILNRGPTNKNFTREDAEAEKEFLNLKEKKIPAPAKEIPPVTEPTPPPKPEASLSRIDRQRAAQKDVTAPEPVQSIANTTFSKNFVKGIPSKEPLTNAMQEMMASFQTLMSPVLNSAKLDTTAEKPGAEGTAAFDTLNDNAQKLVSTFQKMFGLDLTKISNFSASAFGPDATKGEGFNNNFAAGLFNRRSNAIKIRQGANEKGEVKDESFGTLLHESIHAMFKQLRTQTKIPKLGIDSNIDFSSITGGNKDQLKAIEVMYTDLLDKAKNAFIEALAIQNYGSASKANITKATEDMKGMDYFSQPEEIVATMIGDVFKGRIKQEGLFSDKNTSWLSRKSKRKPNSVENSSTLSKGFGFVKNLFGFGSNDESEEMFDEGSQTDFTQMSLPRDKGKTPQSTRQPKAGPGLLKRSASSFAGMTGKLKNNAIALGKKSFGYLKNKTKGGFNAFFNPQQENAKVLAQVITPIVAGIATSLVTLAAGADPLTAATAGSAIAGTTGALAQTKNIAKGLTTTAKGIKDVSVELGSGLGELASDLYKAGKTKAISTGANIASFGVTAGSKIATTAIALKNQLKTIGAKIAGPASAIGKDILNTGIIGSSKEAMRLTGGIGKDIQAGALLAGAGIKKLGISLASKTKSVASVITKFATSKATSAGKGISKFTTKQIFNPAKAGLNTFTESGYLLKAVSSQILKKALNKAAPAFEIGKDIYNTGIVGSSKEAMRLFGEIGNDLTSGFSKAGSGLKKVGKGSVNLASKGGASLKAGVKSAFKFSTNLASTLGTGFVDGTKQSSSLLISGLKDEVKNSPLIKAASFLIKGTMSGVKESSSMMFGGAKEDISNLFQGAMSRGNKAYKGIKGFGNNALTGAKNVGGSILLSVTN